jgi:hypothetical protein
MSGTFVWTGCISQRRRTLMERIIKAEAIRRGVWVPAFAGTARASGPGLATMGRPVDQAAGL